MATKKTTKPVKKQAPKKADSKQLEDLGEKRDKKGRFAKGSKPVAGFNAHPENIASGRWDASNSISYWYNKFNAMTDDQFNTWRDKTPPEQRTQAQKTAYIRVKSAQKSDRLGLDNTREITDRTEGKAPQVVTNNIRRSPLDDLNLSRADLLAIAYGTNHITDDINYDDEKQKGSRNADETTEDA